MATHSSILAWRIPWTEEPGESPWRHKESDMTEATEHAHTRPRDTQVRPVLLASRGGKGTGSDSPSESMQGQTRWARPTAQVRVREPLSPSLQYV